MLSFAYRAAMLVVGLILVAVGIVGLFLPFLQGILLIALGLSVLSLVSERVAGWVRRLRARARLAWRRFRPQRRRSERAREES